MALWGYDKKPIYVLDQDSVATDSGWVDPVTGELLVAIRQLRDKRRDFIDGEICQLIVDEVAGDNIFLTLSPDDGDRPVYLVLNV
jgi:hypothetical protein